MKLITPPFLSNFRSSSTLNLFLFLNFFLSLFIFFRQLNPILLLSSGTQTVMEAATHPPEASGRNHSPGAKKGLDQRVHEKHDSEEGLTSELISAGSEHLQRKLGGKEIQLLAVGGAIGTC